MTLFQLIKTIEAVASRQPSINMVVEQDVRRLNAKPDARYGVFAWTQGQHSASLDSPLMTYSFTFFYVDRLTEDRSNEIEVQSVGIQSLDNIIRTLESMGVEASSYNFQTFTQRFLDECAGVFCSVTFNVPIAMSCAEYYDAFAATISEDFLIY